MMQSTQQSLSLDQYACLNLAGVGPKIAEQLAKLGIVTVFDLLFHLPMRYEDRTKLTAIANLSIGQNAVIHGIIQSTQIIHRPKPQLVCTITDDTDSIALRFIYYSAYQQQQLKLGKAVLVFGQVKAAYRSGLEIIHPEYQLVSPDQPIPLAQNLTPIYASTDGIKQKLWAKLTDQALALWQQADSSLIELLPQDILTNYGLPGIQQAVVEVHRPKSDTKLIDLEQGKTLAQQRLKLEELVAHRLALLALRQQQRKQTAPKISNYSPLAEQFIAQLPFELTNAQQKVYQEIRHDLAQTVPMMRLVQGDVGSGKTVIAALAACHVLAQQQQVALMAPTELLAEQHHQTLENWFQPLGIQPILLKSQLTATERRQVLTAIAAGSAGLIIGTHALFQQQVEFAQLALLIIDEQHRFGVHQRLALKYKGVDQQRQPHQLMMTATPIPRTLAMNIYADLDCSTIDELPKGRQAIQTLVLSNQKRSHVIERVSTICHNGQQVYWVCPLIENSEVLACQAAETTYQQLVQQLPELSIGLVHGRLPSAEKAHVMQQFAANQLQLLVATTVIEVGVNVPNATLMVIENAERMGLAQLHQLRGRIGRGSLASYCILLYQNPLSHVAQERLAIMRASQDGFVIAEKDLAIRGPGEVLGTRQTGVMHLRIADLVRDQALLPKVQVVAEELHQTASVQCTALIKRWVGNKIHCAEV